MKKRLLCVCVFLAVMLIPVSAAAADDNAITREDIYKGIRYCEEFPVKLLVNNEMLPFEEHDIPPLIIKDRTLIPARALFESLGGIVHWDEERQGVEIHFGDSYVSLYIGSNEAWVNGEEQDLEVPAMIIAREGEEYGRTMIPVRFTAEALGFLVDWNDEAREVIIASPRDDDDGEGGENGGPLETVSGPAISFWAPFEYEPLEMMNEVAAQKLIAIDIGHGGKDVGAIANENKPGELYEKDLNLIIGMLLRDYLLEAGANILMTREKDTTLTLAERAEIANNRNAGLFISVHNNSSEFDWPTGTEVHYYSKLDEEERDEKELYGIYSKDVAKRVQKELLASLGTFDRGIKNSPRLGILNRTVMPAIVIEGAFMSNKENLEMIRTEEYAVRYAYATAKAIVGIMNETFKPAGNGA